MFYNTPKNHVICVNERGCDTLNSYMENNIKQQHGKSRNKALISIINIHKKVRVHRLVGRHPPRLSAAFLSLLDVTLRSPPPAAPLPPLAADSPFRGVGGRRQQVRPSPLPAGVLLSRSIVCFVSMLRIFVFICFLTSVASPV